MDRSNEWEDNGYGDDTLPLFAFADDKKTKSYKHVSIDQKRPQLSRGDEMLSKDKTVQKKSDSKAAGMLGATVKKDSKALLKVIPLGGLDGIGKNMTVFQCKNDLIIDDAGLMFPDDNHPGVDLILPDYTYVLENAHMLRGIVITHGHEDHTGALPYLLKDLDMQVPIYATKLTLGLIECKLSEHGIKNAKLCEIVPGQSIELGCFNIEFFAVNHSIPGSVGIFLQSPAGNVLHTGDFKLDQTPIDGVKTDYRALCRFGTIGVDLMMSDSTNAMRTEFTPSEAEVGKELRSIISQAKGRVIIASFASHIHRMQQICDAARASGRKVIVTGRSMIQNTDIARKLGYLNVPDEDLIDAYYLKDFRPEQVVIMCTGSQGEPLSALSRIANGEHKTISVEEGDTVIVSATPVPGNEKAVTRVVNSLAKIGAEVFDKNNAMVHVSGHAASEELKIVLTMVKPHAFMPVHGESMHLRAHAKLAMATGVSRDNVFICDNGETLELTTKGVKRGEAVQSGIVYVDGLSVGDTSQEVLDQRCSMSEQGCAVICAAINPRRHEVVKLQISMRGVTGGDEEFLVSDCESVVKGSLTRAIAKDGEQKDLRKVARDALLSILWERINQRPIVITSILEVY